MARGAADFRYQHVQVRTWSDKKFRELSAPPPNAQTLWMFLLTGEYTTKIPGVIANVGRAGMAEFLEWPLDAFDRCFTEIVDKEMAVADWRNRLIYLPSAFKQTDQHPRSTSTVVTWRKVLNNLPECELRDRIELELRAMLAEISDTFIQSFMSAKRFDLLNKVDEQKPLTTPLSSGLTTALSTSGSARSPDPLPDPVPLPLPLPLPNTLPDSADADSGSGGDVQASFQLECPAQSPIDFESVYRLYPRKVGKGKGKARFERQITTRAKYERFAAAVRNYTAYVQGQGRPVDKIKQFDTFMSDWEDYAPGNFEVTTAAAPTPTRDPGRGQVPVASDLDYSNGGPSE
jgi:hypothetical protein